jgi:demethylmenaquinone methyltransferase / 2-methoxy-6-polyprenyl-1,4-benzoquinol methylase
MEMPPARPAQDVVPPHPTLARYYAHDEDRSQFVQHLFDSAARDYDKIERGMAMGWGRWYRREALRRAGLAPGMRVLDVAIGTGLVAREAARLAGGPARIVGIDPSAGMLVEARRQLGVGGVLGVGEQLPVRDESADFLSLGYALRHLADLVVTFREFHRVLRPGGAVCVLELTKPRSRAGFVALRLYMQRIVPFMTRFRTRNAEAELLMRYFWDTIEACVPPQRILSALDEAGFEGAKRTLAIGLFSEYTARRPGRPGEPVRPLPLPDRDNFFVRRIKR